MALGPMAPWPLRHKGACFSLDGHDGDDEIHQASEH